MQNIFVITSIEGEYAYLKSEANGEELFIALALLPTSVDVGTRLSYENMEFQIL